MRSIFPWFTSDSEGFSPNENSEKNFDQSFLEAGKLLRGRRESLGMSIRELSLVTRITTPVLEAIERGWVDRLPEDAYLSSMLPRLEHNLELREGSLSDFLKLRVVETPHKASMIRFTPGSIDILTSWQGNFIYILVMVLTLFGLNYQQRQASQLSRNSIELIPLRIDNLDSLSTSSTRNIALKGVRPLQDAQKLKSEAWFVYALDQLRYKKNRGLLQVEISKPRDLIIKTVGEEKTNLSGVKGNLNIRIPPPFVLQITPPPSVGDSVHWEGKLYPSEPSDPGLYRVNEHVNSFDASANDRP